MEALLRAEHLKKQFHRNADGKHAVNDVSFEIMPGEWQWEKYDCQNSDRNRICSRGKLVFRGKSDSWKTCQKRFQKKYADDFSESKVVAQSENDHWTKFRRCIAVL